jgi:four helix bundle protein
MRDHRSLKAWQEARLVCLGVLTLSQNHWQPWASALFSQLQRASLSVQLNIAEGATFGRGPTYARHLGIAYGSSVEAGEILALLLDSRAVPEDVGRRMLEASRRSQRLLLGMLKIHRPLKLSN